MSCDEWMRTMYYLCDLCARTKPRSGSMECWCKNKVVRKKIASGRDSSEDVCADFIAKEVEYD